MYALFVLSRALGLASGLSGLFFYRCLSFVVLLSQRLNRLILPVAVLLAILFMGALIPGASPAAAQTRLEVEDFAAQAELRGYTTYSRNTQPQMIAPPPGSGTVYQPDYRQGYQPNPYGQGQAYPQAPYDPRLGMQAMPYPNHHLSGSQGMYAANPSAQGDPLYPAASPFPGTHQISPSFQNNYANNTQGIPSRLEDFYRKRTGDLTLSQFGYDLFYTPAPAQPPRQNSDNNAPDPSTLPMGAVQGDYILQAGDEVTVIFAGEKRSRETYVIPADGRLILEDFPPLTVMGRSLADAQADLKAVAEEAQYRGRIDLTLSGIRQIGVLVAGHVHKPGRQTLNAFHSVLDALNAAGGIRKTGSLRQIKLTRGGQSRMIDLYDFIAFQKTDQAITLRDGDRLFIPPIGQSFAVTGDVKQSGIFELKNQADLAQALRVAGGVLGGGDILYTLTTPGGEVITLSATSRRPITDGAILTVTRATDRLANAIELRGYSRRNGVYDLGSAGTLHRLLGDRRLFGDDTYPLIGVVSRINRDDLTRTLMGFSPQAVAQGADDRQLEAGDILYLFSTRDIEAMQQGAVLTRRMDDDIRLAGGGMAGQPLPMANMGGYPQQVTDFVLDHTVSVQGAVRREGAWPVGTVTDLESLIAVAGGLTAQASRTDIEVTARDPDLGNAHMRHKIAAKDLRLADDVVLQPGDQIRIHENFERAVQKTVTISGEVKQPGQYDLMRGDTLLSLLDRAGGLTQDAYPPAAVFSRKAERKREEQKFRAAAQELERTVSVNLNAADRDAALTPAQISMARQLADELRAVKAVGRVTVEADPAVLSVRPELNMLLEDGDHLHIPKRSLNVRVSGEVMNGSSLLFEEDKDIDDYLDEAGGMTYFADTGRIFVVYPDGSAQPANRSRWGKQTMIIPGSAIIVPRDPKPFDFMDSFKDITQILTNMAITGVFVEDIATDEN